MKILVMGKTDELCAGISELLADMDSPEITCLTSGTMGRGTDISRFDRIIISTPLSDEFGLDFVADISKQTRSGIVVLAKGEIADEVQKKIKFTGAFVLARPFGKAMLIQALKFAEVAREGMLKLEEENKQLSKQISDMKLVNKAKAVLMQYLNLNEEQAHRYIQKQAMDMRKTQSAIAREILQTYQNKAESNNE